MQFLIFLSKEKYDENFLRPIIPLFKRIRNSVRYSSFWRHRVVLNVFSWFCVIITILEKYQKPDTNKFRTHWHHPQFSSIGDSLLYAGNCRG